METEFIDCSNIWQLKEEPQEDKDITETDTTGADNVSSGTFETKDKGENLAIKQELEDEEVEEIRETGTTIVDISMSKTIETKDGGENVVIKQELEDEKGGGLFHPLTMVEPKLEYQDQIEEMSLDIADCAENVFIMSDFQSTSSDVLCNHPHYNESIPEFLQELEDKESDGEIDDSDEDPNYHPSEDPTLSEGDSELDVANEDILENKDEYFIVENYVDEDEFFWGQDGTIWLKKEPNTQRKMPQTNFLPGLTIRSRNLGNSPSKDQVWSSLFDQVIIDQLVVCTNQKLEKVRSSLRETTRNGNYKNVDATEIRALIGLLMLKSIFKCSNETIESIFAKGITGRPVFRATFFKKRFEILLVCLRFDDANTRKERKQSDRAAAISFIFEKFIAKCKQMYSPGTNVTVDEMLVAFRGKCGFSTYFGKNTKKYGLKIVCLTDSSTLYLVDAYIYKGKSSDGEGLTDEEQKLSKPTQAVVRLCKSIEGTNRNITGNKLFSSIELVDELGDRSLTYVGTLEERKLEIPPEFLPSKDRPVGSAVYGFGNTATLLSVVPKKNKAVLFLSSLHHSITNDGMKRKQEIVAYYNKTKARTTVYSSISKTGRWPLAIFFQMVNISCVNSFIIYSTFSQNSLTTKFDFIHDLAMELIKPQLHRRMEIPYLPRDLRHVLQEFFGTPVKENASLDDKLPKRKTCSKCPSSKKRKTAYKCIVCSEPICLECSKKVCISCAKNI